MGCVNVHMLVFLIEQNAENANVCVSLLCGCSASSSTGNDQRMEGKMDSLKYQEILGENITPSVRKLRLGQNWTLQQDNHPKHTSNSTKAWL